MWYAASGTSDGADEVQVVVLEVVHVLGGLRRGSRCPPSRRGLTSAGGIIGVNPAEIAWSIASWTSASSSRAPTPVR